jgi:Fe-S-cluster-containing hydrogenase component 2
LIFQRLGLPVGATIVCSDRCNACGLCHFHCPMRLASAIAVEPVGALRLFHGSHHQAARSAGLTLELQVSFPAPPQDAAGEGHPTKTAAWIHPLKMLRREARLYNL